MISTELLEVLRCPIGKAELKEKDNYLVCTPCGVRYPIDDGIPILLVDEAILPEGVDSVNELECMKK